MRTISLAWISMSTAWPDAPPCGWWMSTRACGRMKRLPGVARGEDHRRGRRGLADADRRHVGLDELHRVVDREQPGDLAAGRVDVDRDVLVGVFALEVEQLRDDDVGDHVVDRRAEEDDAVLQQPREDVVAVAAARGVLGDVGDVDVLELLTTLAPLPLPPVLRCSRSDATGSSATVSAAFGARRTHPAAGATDRRVRRRRRRPPRGRSGTRAPCLVRCPSVPPRAAPAVRDPCAPWRASRPICSARRSISASSSSSVASISSCTITARSAEVGEHRLGGAVAHAVDELLLVLAGGGEVLRDRHARPCSSSRCTRSWRRRSISCCTSGSGTSSGTSAAAASKNVLAHRHLGLHAWRTCRGACGRRRAARRRCRTR